ncbi:MULTISPECIES: MmcQ/YjbR family DNA-binding protein [unclassified Neisseria]|uniref:MmcQ/YjbR family DNA-binding protein n=1 Tax=unclassified Neisseria TaxID=2623750 RepID=UPI001072B995|nr:MULTISPECIES: MmcQ/YjbR family DNA-binding protein [unclassified Neisseria]MBF0802769.1 MmcQ/YjbR family DNA-binding protein [Neisseria sp. 19428wB4_WF04]TFU44568.1 MmcQ/YjbR family DNA-binding protein [Neisseria sp. WF04]
MSRRTLLDYAAQHYLTVPEYPWRRHPDYAVLRHTGNGRWYAVLMDVPAAKLGLAGSANVPLANIKAAPDLVQLLRVQTGFLPAYHMNKTHWLSVRLDGSVNEATVKTLLDGSFALTRAV